VQLGPGDRVLFFTDGLPEATTPLGGPIGYDALCSLLAGGTAPPGEWLDALFARLRAATSSTLEDDWTALVLERT
jgi:serine phosphatase RsbU (regulator of sigma subunit)